MLDTQDCCVYWIYILSLRHTLILGKLPVADSKICDYTQTIGISNLETTMSENKLLTRLKSYLDLSNKRRKKKADELKKIIRKIRKKEKELIIECRNTAKSKSKQQKTLEKRIAILHAQRKKGLKALKKIKQQ